MQSIIFEYITKHWKNATILVLLALLVICTNHDYVSGTVSKVHATTVTKSNTKTNTKTKQIEVVKKDGTKTTITEVASESGTVSASESSVLSTSDESRSTSNTGSSKSRYSVDVAVRPLAYKEVGVTLGARLGDLPVFATVGYVANSIYVGIRGEL